MPRYLKSLFFVLVSSTLVGGTLNAQSGDASPAGPSYAPPMVGTYADLGPHFSALDGKLNAARNAIGQKDYAAARKILVPLHNLGFLNPEVYSLSGLAYLGLGKNNAAISYFEHAVRMSGYEDVGANHGLALAHIAKGDAKRAAIVTARLEKQSRKCASVCQKAAMLDAALASIARASK